MKRAGQSRLAAVVILALCAVAAWLALGDGTSSESPPGVLVADEDVEDWLDVQLVHDLITDWLDARLELSGPRAPYNLIHSTPGDQREHAAGLLALPGSSITFDGLATAASPSIHFAIGSVRSATPKEFDLPVAFCIEGRRRPPVPHEELGWKTLFETTLTYGELPPPSAAALAAGAPPNARLAPYELALPGDSAAHWDLRFSTTQPGLTSQQAPVSWPGWIAPLLVSAPQRVRRADHPVHREVTQGDLLATLSTAAIIQQRPGLPVEFAVLDAALGIPIVGGPRRTLRAATPSRVDWDLDVLPDTTLQFDVGMDTEAGWTLPGDGMAFAIEINGDTAWRFDCNAPGRQLDRGWKTAVLDLGPWTGQHVKVSLVTTDLGDPANDVGGWSRVDVVANVKIQRLMAHEAPTVVVLVADTLRADALGSFGGPPGNTPHLDALASSGLTFVSAHATSSWTWPSTASLFTGLYPLEHGMVDHLDTWLDGEFVTLAECFQAAGYSTGGFLANSLFNEPSNMSQGFETFINLPQATAATLNARISPWLAKTEGTARFLYVHYMDPHAPYAPPDPWLPGGTYDPQSDLETITAVLDAVREGHEDAAVVRDFTANLVQRYDAEVHYLDNQVGELLTLLEEHHALDNALVVFTADHGEEFGEHRLLSHGGSLYEETLRVPLSITGFGKATMAPTLIRRNVLNMDLLPSLCTLVGIPVPAVLAQRPLLHVDGPPQPTFAQTLHGFDHDVEGFIEKLSVIHENYKLVYTPAAERTELYDLTADPQERHNVAEEQPARAAALKAQLEHWIQTANRPPKALPSGASAELLERMQQLGYIER